MSAPENSLSALHPNKKFYLIIHIKSPVDMRLAETFCIIA